MKKCAIVVAVDYSNASVAAVDNALKEAAKNQGAVLVPVLVLPYARETKIMEPDGDFLESARANLIDLVTSRVPPNVAVPEIQPDIRFGEPEDGIVSCAVDHEASMLVMGTHGRSAMEQLVLGSVTVAVIREAPCPVLVVRPDHATIPDAPRQSVRPPAVSSAETGEAAVILSEAHLDQGNVVVHVLDQVTGRPFVCTFESRREVTVESLERDWVTAASAEERARVVDAVRSYGAEEGPLLEQLFEERERRTVHTDID